jgi:hypothetical protein
MLEYGCSHAQTVFAGVIVYIACMLPDQHPDSYVDVIVGAYVTKLFTKRLEKKLFPSNAQRRP